MVNEYTAYRTEDTEVTLKSVKLKNYGQSGYCLDVTYVVDGPADITEVNIPCVHLPITQKKFTIREVGDTPYRNVLVDIGFGSMHAFDEFGKPTYTVKVIKEKTKEMTLEEIEKKLGHKVKIVSDKK